MLAAAGIAVACTLAAPRPPGEGGAPQGSEEEQRVADEYVRRFQLAQKMMGVGKDAEAEALLRELLAEQPDAAAVHHALAYVHSFQKRPAEAMEGFLRAAELAPEDGAIRRDCGMRLVEAGRFADAIPHLEAARRLLDADVETLCAYGRALEGAGRAAAAEKAYRDALAADPNSVDARALLARRLLESRPAESTALLERVQPNWPDVVEVRALAFERQTRWDEGAASWGRLAEISPRDATGVPTLRAASEGLVRCGAAKAAADVAARWAALDRNADRPGLRASLCLAVAIAGTGDAVGALAALDAPAPLPEKAPAALRAHLGMVRVHLLVVADRADDARRALEVVAATDAPFERAAAQFLLGREPFTGVAEAAKSDAGRANDAEWVAWLGARLAGDAAVAARALDAARAATRPPGEHPGMLLAGVR